MPKTKAPADEKKVTIRIPTALHQQLVTLAQNDSRSLNSEVLVLLQEAIEFRNQVFGERLDAVSSDHHIS